MTKHDFRFTPQDHERMKEVLDNLSDNPTEEEAEAVLQACGTSGKEVVNEFIERLVKENLGLKQELARRAAVAGPLRIGSEVLKIIRFALTDDRKALIRYSLFLAEKVEQDEPRLAAAIRSYVEGKFGNAITPAATSSPAPADGFYQAGDVYEATKDFWNEDRCGVTPPESTRVAAPSLTAAEKLPLPTDYECIAPSEQVLVINLLRGICDADKQEAAQLHLNLCARCQELAGGVVPGAQVVRERESLTIEGNREGAIKLLRQLREAADPEEIQRQKESWAQLEAALNPTTKGDR